MIYNTNNMAKQNKRTTAAGKAGNMKQAKRSGRPNTSNNVKVFFIHKIWVFKQLF